jgi:hypothetical protein
VAMREAIKARPAVPRAPDKGGNRGMARRGNQGTLPCLAHLGQSLMMMLLLLMMMTMHRRQALVPARGRGRPAGATRGPVQAGMRAADRGRRRSVIGIGIGIGKGFGMGRRGKHVVVNTLWGGKHARRDAKTEEAPEHARLDEA